MKFYPRSQFEPLFWNYVPLRVICTIQVKYNVSEIYFDTSSSLVNPDIAERLLPPPYISL